MSPQILLYLLSRRQNRLHLQSGFTLIELLVVIVIVGILGAIALPSYLSQANKARQTEAKTYVGAINRAQQAYHMEYSTFANLQDLALNISSSTQLYRYASAPAPDDLSANTTAIPNFNSTVAYSGRVWLVSTAGTTSSVLCEGTSSIPPAIQGTTCP
ncbi:MULTISPECIES: type IV pilin-like G/H family protein [unclassified Leptolyngbya]|uniref:type IV pilin-like G/H family protein n=1 Tax=unclassified Leptolyngbya TaxID=2650499 RepID=UPI00168695A2|nr:MULTISPECIES: type IV pilin-like G/H family protein [unclassified Leptolyngbya]